MSEILLLDSGPLGWIVNPRRGAEARGRLDRLGQRIALPEISLYEVRRELVRVGGTPAALYLDELAATITYVPISTPVVYRACELWAEARNGGYPTAGAEALDGDVILAATAQVLTEAGHDVAVVTTNVRHLERFVRAVRWEDLK